MGRRLLRYCLIGLGLLLLGGLWAFSFYFFNPFEGGYDGPIASLIPRDVDFYAAKNHLRRDFDSFPRPAFLDEFEASPSGRALLDLGLSDQVASWKIEQVLGELETVLAQLPVRVDPLSVFGGEGLALAGHFVGTDLSAARWAVYGRASWLGKLALELVAGGWIDLAAQGVELEPFEEGGKSIGVELSGGKLARPIFLARIQDVVIVSTDGALLSAARALEATRGQDSLDRLAKYADNVLRAGRPDDELEVYLAQYALAANLKLEGTWPDPRSNDPATALCARLFRLGTLRDLIGTAHFSRTLSLDFVGELVSNSLTPFMQRLYDQRGFDRAQMLEAGRLVPGDAGLFAYVHADVGDLLRELRSVFQALDPAVISNIEDFVRQAWNYPDLEPLIDDIDAALRDRVGFFLRDYVYAEEVGALVPPHDDTQVFAWAMVLWPQDQARIDAIRSVIIRADVQDMLKIQGAEAGSRGLYENTLQGGAKVNEYWNVLVPGTGQIATLEMKGRESYLVISNENRLLGEIFKIYNTGTTENGLAPLSENQAFITWVDNGLPSANLLAWFAPRAIEKTHRLMAEQQASERGADLIDWRVERPRIEREVIAQHFPGETWSNVSAANRSSYEMLVDQEVNRFQASYMEQHLPELRGRAVRMIEALGAIDGSFFQLATDRKRLHLQGRIGLGFLTPE